jgi:flagellar biosynthetic protein FliP
VSLFPVSWRQRLLWLGALCGLVCLLVCQLAQAQGPTPPRQPTPPTAPQVWVQKQAPQELALSLRLLFSLGALAVLPSAFVTMTSFTRIIIVLGFLRSALGTQQTPPNTVLVGLAFFLTLFVMQPVWNEIDRKALKPYMAGTMTYPDALNAAAVPLRSFMLKQTRERDLVLFMRLGHIPQPRRPDDVPMRVLLPAFAISELKTAFQVGFVVYLPFIVLDLVVAGALMSLGMLMLPPGTISLPLKILLFVMIDGWHLVARSLVFSFT